MSTLYDLPNDDLEITAAELERIAFVSGDMTLARVYAKITNMALEAGAIAKEHEKEVREAYKDGKEEGMGDEAFAELEDLKYDKEQLQDKVQMLQEELRKAFQFIGSADSKLAAARQEYAKHLQNRINVLR